MPRTPLRQKDIAAAAHVNPSTISRALNNDPRLPMATRNKIRALAATMGYRPDPLLSALSSYRRRGGSGRMRPAMAYLRRASAPRHPYHADLLRGAVEFAALYGYTIDYLPYDRPNNPALERVLQARGIRGLLIEPILPEDAGLKIDFARFAVVVVDNPFFSPDYDRVTFDNFGGGKEAFEQCFRRGYVRPGLVLSELADRNGEHKVRGGYLMKMLEHGLSPPARPLIIQEWNDARFRRWLKEESIDAVITSQMFLAQAKAALLELGRRIPQQVGLLNNNIHELPATASGIYHNNEGIGAFAAELLINKLARNDYGASAHPHVISQRGRWIEGGTLRKLPARAGAAQSLGERLTS